MPHPCMPGMSIAIRPRPLSLSAEQMFTLVDELQSIAFLAPHLAVHVDAIARELELSSVAQFVAWMREADARKAAK